jgi:hypothetical protein
MEAAAARRGWSVDLRKADWLAAAQSSFNHIMCRPDGPVKPRRRIGRIHRHGLSYRLIGRNLGISKHTVMEIVRRAG